LAFGRGGFETRPEPDVRISRIRLSDWLHLEAHDGPPPPARPAGRIAASFNSARFAANSKPQAVEPIGVSVRSGITEDE